MQPQTQRQRCAFAKTWVRRRLASMKELMRYLIPVVRLNIRGRSHCTWLCCPIHPRHTEPDTSLSRGFCSGKQRRLNCYIRLIIEWGKGGKRTTNKILRKLYFLKISNYSASVSCTFLWKIIIYWKVFKCLYLQLRWVTWAPVFLAYYQPSWGHWAEDRTRGPCVWRLLNVSLTSSLKRKINLIFVVKKNICVVSLCVSAWASSPHAIFIYIFTA